MRGGSEGRKGGGGRMRGVEDKEKWESGLTTRTSPLPLIFATWSGACHAG